LLALIERFDEAQRDFRVDGALVDLQNVAVIDVT
jgi:hypothetical protein